MMGWRGMVGLIVPSNNGVILPEIYRALPEGVTAYETRMRAGAHVTPEAINRMVDDALEAGALLAEANVGMIAYCCMGSSVFKGWDWEEDLQRQLATIGRCPVTSANTAILEAIRHVGAKTVQLVTPYPKAIDELLPQFFAARGVTVRGITKVKVNPVGPEPAHNRDIRFVEPRYLYTLARAIDPKGIDAVCFLATDMETMATIDALERDLGLPVLSNNQAIVWEIVRRLKLNAKVSGYGRLLAD